MGKGMDFREIEKKWQESWIKEKTYSFDPNRRGDIYSIDTPPPTVSGKMHLGHAFSYSQADFIARFKRMSGYNVFYPFGFDDNGLATERLVEKSRNIKAKDFTREEFIKICLDETRKHEETMRNDFASLGLSVDWGLVYRTIDKLARKVSQKSFLDLYKKGRVYRKEAPSIWCPRCETTLAQAELNDVDLDSTFNDIIFKMENGEDLIIATTRPELLPSCVAVFIHPSDERKKELLGKEAIVPLFGFKVPIIEDERVDPEKGTGIVMCCTFGDQTDMEWYFAHNLPLKMSISKDGKMTKLAGKYEGMKIKEARKEIINDLKEAGLLLKQTPIKHTVKVHERCNTEIEILNAKQWFIKYLDLKEEFLEKGKELDWFPKHMRVRYENWIKGLQWDWSISRQRFFGVPFPVWYDAESGKEIVASEEELPVDPLTDKPKNYDSENLEPEKDVMDTWATSSLTPQINAKWGIDDELYKKIFPMSLRPQAHDIITLWAFNTIVKANFHEGKLPWKDIMISGHALDAKGRKMSKSLGNTVSPQEMIDKYSADVLRYWSATGSLGEDLPFQEKEFVAGKKFLTKLYNASRFVAMQTEGVKPRDLKSENLREVDKWILSRLNRVIKVSTESLEKYEFSKAFSAVRNFFWLEFADYYIEIVKRRVYEDKDDTAKAVLVKVMTDVLKMLAPFVPHVVEETYQANFKHCLETNSVHLEKWPKVDENFIDTEAEEAGKMLKDIIAGLRKYKSENNLAMNSELEEVKVFGNSNAEKVKEDIADTMKVKSVVVGEGKGKIVLEKGISISVK